MDERASVRKPGIPIATRTLTWREGDKDVPVEIRIYEPEKESESAWDCRFEIAWPDRLKQTTIYGVDAVQALVLALQMVAVEIYVSDYHKSGNLHFEKPGAGYGFPTNPSIRDLLEGDDKKYL